MRPPTLIYRRAIATAVSAMADLTLRDYQDYQAILSPADWIKMETSLANEHLYAELLHRAAAFVCAVDNQLVGGIFLIPKGNPTTIFPPIGVISGY